MLISNSKFRCKRKISWSCIRKFVLIFIIVHFVILIVIISDKPDDKPEELGFSCQFKNLTTKTVFFELKSGNNWNLSDRYNELLSYVKNCHLTPPSDLPYNLDKTKPIRDDNTKHSVWQYVWEILSNEENGTFIDIGAGDGEEMSNTLNLERDHGWSGLLIEGDPSSMRKLMTKNRNSWVANAYVGVHSFPYKGKSFHHYQKSWTDLFVSRVGIKAEYEHANEFKKLRRGGSRKHTLNSNYLPLYTILLAWNRTSVDFLSMKMGGVELQVLQTLPFRKIGVTVFSIETTPKTTLKVKEFMKSKNYKLLTTFRGKYIQEDIYAHMDWLSRHFMDYFIE